MYKDLVNVFNYDGLQIRIVIYEGEPWFVASEVAGALGYQNPRKAVIDHCKHVKLLKSNACFSLTSSPQGINIIPEGDVYRLTMKSRLESAVKFQDWVTDEVLPTLRKTGKYEVDPAEMSEVEAAEQYLAIAQKYVEVVKEKERLAIELKEQAPKVLFFDTVAKSDQWEDMLTVAKTLNFVGMGRNNIMEFLRDKGIFDRRNQPYQTYVNQGLFKIVEKPYQTVTNTVAISTKTVVSQKGLIFIANLLRNSGYYTPDDVKLTRLAA